MRRTAFKRLPHTSSMYIHVLYATVRKREKNTETTLDFLLICSGLLTNVFAPRIDMQM